MSPAKVIIQMSVVTLLASIRSRSVNPVSKKARYMI